ncbi:prepilin-type N-terminal cleavage/methylation domain-containing protein [Clostridium tetanomorphum]|uniref:Prepilin-type N-terminal cleavage/methylation domain-containing protein n=2 Tax=Clostridium tetanomorphum TaxID=1553 RepID=A0A923J349_CLOTT|nr:prepilin-type N-terminal cleavage/methylation domain-containing protein [Clostridium tetanomorphum]MBC2399640.1 prepilin-type N-terminal cleavage/methylation domain-containing protein [Clostridium tetanomorphum]
MKGWGLMKKVKKGFTLVELLVVIAIIAILAAIIAPNAFKAIEKSKVATAESDYKAIKTAALSYYSDTGEWPKNDDEKNGEDPGFVTNPGEGLGKVWNGPYLEKWPTKNPWGGMYIFCKNKDFELDDGDKEVKYIKLTQVPESARDRLEADLDGDSSGRKGVVRYNDKDDKNIYLIISEQ